MAIRNEKITTAKWIVIVPIIFIIIGAVMGFFAFKQKADNESFMKTALQVSATCNNVWMTTSTDDDGYTDYYYHADIEYEYNGIKYQKSDMDIDENTTKGDTITVYIDPSNPSDARYEYTQTDFVMMLIVGGAFAAVGLITTIALVTVIKKQNAAVDAQPWERE